MRQPSSQSHWKTNWIDRWERGPFERAVEIKLSYNEGGAVLGSESHTLKERVYQAKWRAGETHFEGATIANKRKHILQYKLGASLSVGAVLDPDGSDADYAVYLVGKKKRDEERRQKEN